MLAKGFPLKNYCRESLHRGGYGILAFGVHSNIELLHHLNEEPEASISTIRLTPRGREVFELAMSGLSIREISKRLGISYSGVLRHREKMLLANECNPMLELIATYRGTYPNRQL